MTHDARQRPASTRSKNAPEDGGQATGALAADLRDRHRDHVRAAVRVALVCLCLFIGLSIVTGQLVRLAILGQAPTRVAVSAPISESFARPSILDRNGRPLAIDVVLPSITADPARILDVDEAVAKLGTVLSPADMRGLREKLANRSSRFAWVARKVSTALAERINNIGLPGITFRWETKRTYPQGALAGHVLGAVNADNKGVAGLERHLDHARGLRHADRLGLSDRPALRTTLDIGVQHATEQELLQAVADFAAKGGAALIMDVETGAIRAAASVPTVDPAFPETWVTDGPVDRVQAGSYELGSVMKIATIAMALDTNIAGLDTLVAAHEPLAVGSTTFSDGPARRAPLTVADVFLKSSNVGVGRLVRAAGTAQQRAFLSRIGLIGPMATEARALGLVATPGHWGDVEAVTIAYGHGISVSPLQFAATAAALINGGLAVQPTFIGGRQLPAGLAKRVVSSETSAALRGLMRANVATDAGSGSRARVAGLRVGGKTGTADRLGPTGRYDGANVTTSFLAAYPMEAPRYVVMVTLFSPKRTDASDGERSAAFNAAPTAGRIIARTAPLLGVYPNRPPAP